MHRRNCRNRRQGAAAAKAFASATGRLQWPLPFLTPHGPAALPHPARGAGHGAGAATAIAAAVPGRRALRARQPRRKHPPNSLDTRTDWRPYVRSRYLARLGIELPTANAPAAAYVMAAQTGNTVFVSGHIARKDGKPWAGKLGKDPGTEDGKAAARAIAIDLLATLHAHRRPEPRHARGQGDEPGQFDSGIHRAAPVTNGASEFFVEIFGDAGKHRPQRLRRGADPDGRLRRDRDDRRGEVSRRGPLPQPEHHAMRIDNLPFGTTDWSTIEPTLHPGEHGEACWRTRQFGDIRVRMVEYSAGYLADHWCKKGHILFVPKANCTPSSRTAGPSCWAPAPATVSPTVRKRTVRPHRRRALVYR